MQTYYIHPVPVYQTDIDMPYACWNLSIWSKNMIDIRLVKFMDLMQYIVSNLYIEWIVLNVRTPIVILNQRINKMPTLNWQ